MHVNQLLMSLPQPCGLPGAPSSIHQDGGQLCAWLQGTFIPDEEELTARPKGALQDSKISLATPGKFFGVKVCAHLPAYA